MKPLRGGNFVQHQTEHDMKPSQTDGVMTNCNSLPCLVCRRKKFRNRTRKEEEEPNENEREEVLLPWPPTSHAKLPASSRCLPQGAGQTEWLQSYLSDFKIPSILWWTVCKISFESEPSYWQVFICSSSWSHLLDARDIKFRQRSAHGMSFWCSRRTGN